MRIRPSPQPRSYMKSPFLTSASSSIRSTTGIVVGTNGIGSCDHAVELLKTNSKAAHDAICLSFKGPPPSRKIWLSSVQDRMKWQLLKDPRSMSFRGDGLDGAEKLRGTVAWNTQWSQGGEVV